MRFRRSHFVRQILNCYTAKVPADLVQLDTLQPHLQSDNVHYKLSARDFFSRWDRARAYRKQNSLTATWFLEYLGRKFLFRIKAILIDGGLEFKSTLKRRASNTRLASSFCSRDSPGTRAVWNGPIQLNEGSLINPKIWSYTLRKGIGDWNRDLTLNSIQPLKAYLSDALRISSGLAEITQVPPSLDNYC